MCLLFYRKKYMDFLANPIKVSTHTGREAPRLEIRAWFLNLNTIDILPPFHFLYRGAIPCIVGFLAASLASAHCIPVTPTLYL